jgi:signal transduction histidine kinase
MTTDYGEESTKRSLLIREMIQMLVDIVHQVFEVDNLTINLERIYDMLLTFQDYSAVWVYRRAEKGDGIYLHSHKGLPPALAAAERSLAPDGCLVEFVLRTGQPISLKNMDHCQRLPAGLLAEHLPLQAHISLPMKETGVTTGVLNVGTRNKRNFVLQEIQFLVLVAGVISFLFQQDRSRRLMSQLRDSSLDLGLQDLVERMVDGILLMDREFRVTLINPANRPFLGSLSEFEKGEFFDKLSELQQPLLKDLIQGGKDLAVMELALTGPAGKVIQLTASPRRRADGEIETVTMVVKDITGEKALARREQLQTRVSSIESLLEGITHELNNPLAAVSGYLQMLHRRFIDEPWISDITEKMDRELNRAVVIVRNLVALAQKRPIEKVPAQLDRILTHLVTEMEPVFKKSGIEVNLGMDENLPVLYIEVDNIRQVFRSLIDNSAQKMTESQRGGTLNIAVHRKPETIQIVFADTQPGVFQGDAARMLDPTTNPGPVEDAEIRLAFCFAVVKNHGGVIYAEAEAGKGVGFVVELPIFTEEPGTGPSPPSHPLE